MGALTIWSEKQIALIKKTVAKDCDRDSKGANLALGEFDWFMEICRALKLDPLRKQIYCFCFHKDDLSKRQMVPVIGIGGYRSIAERTGNYRPGPAEIVYDEKLKDPDCNPLGISHATVTVYKHSHGEWHSYSDTAHWDEYAPIRESVDEDDFEWVDTGEKWADSGKPKMKKKPKKGAASKARLDPKKEGWRKMGRIMIEKCFSADTEVLTSHGFQKFGEVTASIMQVTDRGLEPTAAVAFSQDYDGDMITLDSDDLNFSVTPNHDMITTGGKIEAGALYENARSRAMHFIPRVVSPIQVDALISDRAIQLSAAFLADGSGSYRSFRIAVSRAYKIEALEDIGGFYRRDIKKDAGRVARTEHRDIATRSDKQNFAYKMEMLEGLCTKDKGVDFSLLGSLSRRQSKLFVDTLIQFDGSDNGKGVRRFGSSSSVILGAFEVAAVGAGYAVSMRRTRKSDIGKKTAHTLSISERDAIGVIRWGRQYNNLAQGRKRTGVEITQNKGGKVWCVTVPSGAIVVRRNGFSMICGNCAEAKALRRGWPDDFSGTYAEGELDKAEVIDLTATEMAENAETTRRLEYIGGANKILIDWTGEQIVPVAVGEFGDRAIEFIKKNREEPSVILKWQDRNRHGLQQYWAMDKDGALALKQEIEKATAA